MLSSRGISTLALYVAGFGALSLIASWITSGSSRNLFLGGLGLIAAAMLLRILSNWREGIYLAFLWLLFEDLARKYLGNNMAIFFGKDLLVGFTYFSFMTALPRQKGWLFRPHFLGPLMVFVLYGFAQFFNPNSPSIFYGLLGLRVYFFYIPLLFLGYHLLENEMDLRRLLVMNTVIAAVIALVGIIQSTIYRFFLNPKKLDVDLEELGHLERVTPWGLRVPRTPSVFVSDGRYANYLMLAFILAFGGAGYILMRKHRGWGPLFGSLIIIVAGALFSGSRSCVLYIGATAVVLSAAMAWGTEWQREQAQRLSKAIRRAAVAMSLGLLLTLVLFPTEIAKRWEFYSETLSPGSEHYELGFRLASYPVQEFIKAFSYPNWSYGNGIGTLSLGLQYVRKIFHVPRLQMGVENGFGQIILELGVPGLLLWLSWTCALAISSWRVLLSLKKTPFFPIGVSIFLFDCLLLFPLSWGSLGMFQNYVITAYFWLLVGVLWRLPELASVQQPSTAESPAYNARQSLYRRSFSVSR